MKIQNLTTPPPVRHLGGSPPTPGALPDLRDQVDLDSAPRKTLGAWGALGGLCLGRAATVAGAAAGGLKLGQTLGGGLGGVAGLAVGGYLGYLAEKKTRVGRLAGGMVGGALGSALGCVAGAVGWQPSDRMGVETRGFSLSSLPKKLLNPNYTSHHRLTPEEAAPGIALVKPGDIIITSDDEDFQLEFMQKAIGASANWTHAAIVDEQLQANDIYITTNKPVKNPVGFIFGDNHHASILRPKYASPEHVTKTLDYVRSRFDNTTYDHKFDLETDDAQYCQELVWKGLRAGAPEIHVPTRNILGLKEMLTSDEFRASPDLVEVWSTGSDFKTNFLSKVT